MKGTVPAVKLAVCYCVHDDHWYFERSLASVKSVKDRFCFVSNVSWSGETGDTTLVKKIAKDAGAKIVEGDWPDETSHRTFIHQHMKDLGYTHILMPDTDEILEPKLLDSLVAIARGRIAERVHVTMDTYWKNEHFCIRPREQLKLVMLLDLDKTEFSHVREYIGGRQLILSEEYGLMHHMSYGGPDERIWKKINTWSHKHEVVRDWYNNVWNAWNDNPLMHNLHPTHPQAYGFAERIQPPEIVLKEKAERPAHEAPKGWPSLSVVIPLYGGPTEIENCLTSLETLGDLISEVIVVDDCSPDDAPAIVKKFPFAQLQTNKQNSGFAKTCNAGFEKSTGEVVIFLNSDTIVPRTGLIGLIEALQESGSIAASGPMTNNAGYYQRTPVTYTSAENIELFAQTFAKMETPNEDTEMLVGFCLAVKREVLEEVGLFDERFGVGLFEDTDLCYRILRAGYRLRIAKNAFVHHEGSKSLTRTDNDIPQLFKANEAIYVAKWRADLESGYATHLPGLTPGRVKFSNEKHPDRLKRNREKLKKSANISLCMIVKNEERVLEDCLKSVTPFFNEIIIVDTGSTDKTVEIAKRFTDKVSIIKWPDSFAEARNASIKDVTGKWIFWIDADDTLPEFSGDLILQAATSAPDEISGFIVPVQFVEESEGGTRVDHVKLIRNVPGVKFEGRIHEQVLQSLKPHGEIAKLDGAVVLHSGYDTSDAGQARKRERDWKLLALDLKDRPKHPFVHFNIGMTHHFSAEHTEAIESFKKSIELSGETDSHLRKAYALMGTSYRLLGDHELAAQTYEEGLQKVGVDPELLFLKAIALTSLERDAEAILCYESMPQSVGDYYSSVDTGILTFKKFHNLGLLLRKVGRLRHARECFQRAVSSNGQWIESYLGLFDVCMEMGDFKGAQTTLDNILTRNGPSIDWAERLDLLESESNGVEASFHRMRLATQQFPRAGGPALVLCRKLCRAGAIDEAVPMLKGLNEAGVAEAAYFLGVAALRTGDLTNGKLWMQRTLELDPGSNDAKSQLEALNAQG